MANALKVPEFHKTESAATLSYCGQQVRSLDSDRFLTCLFAPPPAREALFALYALNLELAKTRDMVSEPLMGRIRLQWWREAIAELYAGTVRAHPVLRALAPVLPCAAEEVLVQALIDARELDMEDEAPANGTVLRDYARGIGGGLMELAVRLLGAQDEALAWAARDIGEGVGLAGILRSVPHYAARNKTFLPADLMREVYLNPDSPRFGQPFGVEIISGLIAAEAERLIKCHPGRIERRYIPAFLPAALALLYLRQLARHDHNPFNVPAVSSSPWKPLLLAQAWINRAI